MASHRSTISRSKYPRLGASGAVTVMVKRLTLPSPGRSANTAAPAKLVRTLDPELVRVLQEAAALLAQGERPEVRAAAPDQMLTTQEAADELGVSRPHLVKLLDAGQMPFHLTSASPGAHRRISRLALEDYKLRRARADDALREMSEIDQELDA